jgi:hypothetical protein
VISGVLADDIHLVLGRVLLVFCGHADVLSRSGPRVRTASDLHGYTDLRVGRRCTAKAVANPPEICLYVIVRIQAYFLDNEFEVLNFLRQAASTASGRRDWLAKAIHFRFPYFSLLFPVPPIRRTASRPPISERNSQSTRRRPFRSHRIP